MADAHVFRMPSLGADMTEGTILEWLVAPGDTVARGDLVAVVKTDKADVEVEIFEAGTIAEVLANVGETLPVGAPLARLATDGESQPVTPIVEVPAVATAAADTVADTPATRPESRAVPPPVAAGDRIAATPYARTRAAELGVELATVAPTQPGHPITAGDVEHAHRTAAAPAPPDQASAMRMSIARLMARSKREIPHYYLDDDIDVTHTLHWLANTNADRPVAERVLPAALMCKAVALAAREHPDLNGFWIDGAFEPSTHVHLGVAISLRGGGLVAPALHDADLRPLPDLMRGLRDLTTRARSGRLRASEMTDATLTVTMLGDQGVRSVFGVIYPPQVALVGFGKVLDRAWDVDGGLGLRSIVNATLAADHRATDGHLGARFLATVGRRLQHPEDLS